MGTARGGRGCLCGLVNWGSYTVMSFATFDYPPQPLFCFLFVFCFVYQTTSVLLLGAVLLTTLYAIRKLRVNQLCPPGPRGFPLLGYLNVLRVPDKRKLFAALREQHGDVFSFYLGCRLVVVINGFETLRQAFVHQGGSFMDRPQIFSFTYVGQGKGKAEVLFRCICLCLRRLLLY